LGLVHWALSLTSILLIISISTFLLVPAFAQMESMRIEGNQYPLVNSFYSFKVIIEGTSRASYGTFNVVATITEKDTGLEIDAIPDFLRSGTNTFTVDMKSYLDNEEKYFKAGETYVIKLQHVNQIAEFEFTPVATVEEMSQKDISDTPHEEIPEIPTEKQNEEKEFESGRGIWVERVLTSSIEGRYIPDIEICTGSQRLVSPEIIISSDVEEIPISIGYVIAPNSCREYNHAKIRANDPDTISVQFVEKTGKDIADLKKEVESLREEVSELRNKLDEKDAVIFEQIKVIQDLATMIQKTIFEPIFNYFEI